MSERLDLLEDGRIRLAFGDEQHTLRRPTMGEFREMRTRLDELVVEARVARADETRGPIDQTDEITEWVLTACKLLSDSGGPTMLTDALPPWFSAPELPGKLIAHWRTVPLGPGSR